MSGYGGRDRLSVTLQEYTLALDLGTDGPAVLHGEAGLLDFGQAGHSYYYSRTRMAASGTLTVQGREIAIAGEAWFDHQWGDFQPGALGWDWFSLQLDDGSDVMLFQIRDIAGNTVLRTGTLVLKDGGSHALKEADFQTSASGSWISPSTGIAYPMGWSIQIPGRQLNLALEPVIREAEFDARATTQNLYWEGEVEVAGALTGRGFVELVGYGINPSSGQ